jgi:hypothetical protein
MEARPPTLGIQVAVGPDDDAEQVAEAILQLPRQLLDVDVEAVEWPRAGEAPLGTRALELNGDVLEPTRGSSTEQRRLTDEWLRPHTGS